MRQFVGKVRDDSTVRDLLVSVAPGAGARGGRRGRPHRAADDGARHRAGPAGLRAGARRLGRRRRLRLRDALGRLHRRGPRHAVRARPSGARSPPSRAGSRSGSCSRRCCAGPRRCSCSTSRTTTSTCRPSAGSRTSSSSRPRRCCSSATTASCSTGWPPGSRRSSPARAGSTLWVHPGRFSTYQQAREDRNRRLEELRRRWDEEHAKLKALVVMYRQKAAYNADMASRLQAAETRLRRFEEAGPPEAVPLRQNVRMRLTGGRTAKRAVVAEGLELHGPDAAVRPRGLVRRAGRGARQQRLGQVALPAAARRRRHATPTPSTGRSATCSPAPVAHTGRLRLGSRVRPGLVRPDPRAPDADRAARCSRSCTAATSTGPGKPREEAARALDRYGLARASEQTFDSLSGGQQARFQILLLELSGATCLLLDEPTDNLDLHSAEALEEGLAAFEGTVSRSPTTAGSPGASTASWCSAPTAGSTSRTSRSGTRAGSPAPAEGPVGQDTAKSCRNCEREAPRRGAGPLG